MGVAMHGLLGVAASGELDLRCHTEADAAAAMVRATKATAHRPAKTMENASAEQRGRASN